MRCMSMSNVEMLFRFNGRLVAIYIQWLHARALHSRKTRRGLRELSAKPPTQHGPQDPLSTCKLAFNNTLTSDFLCRVVTLQFVIDRSDQCVRPGELIYSTFAVHPLPEPRLQLPIDQ